LGYDRNLNLFGSGFAGLGWISGGEYDEALFYLAPQCGGAGKHFLDHGLCHQSGRIDEDG
ncbi:MAG: hypothetical protein ABTS22_09740, partial [Accumulibacter sp.]|uniref:hypothetical protein n=1 Tax=Accumulibacter sp. TaxID=2053492 RepID=UPI003315AC90